jgi:DNA-binding transcriptional ArsR family regulator
MSLQEFTKVTRALRDPNRVRVVKMLQHGELCVCEIQAAFGMSQSNVSKHLTILTAGRPGGAPQEGHLGILSPLRSAPVALCGQSAGEPEVLAGR